MHSLLYVVFMIEFNFTNTDSDFPEEPHWCCHVDDYPRAASGKLTLIGHDELLTSLEEITLRIDYPLRNAALINAKSKGGFTRLQLMKIIYNGYRSVYKEERASGKYGIWGAPIGHFFLEGADISDDGTVELHIGT